MKEKIIISCAAIILLLGGAEFGFGQKNTRTGKMSDSANQTNVVCPLPDKPCNHKYKRFDAWELSFRMPVKLAANKEYKSALFYAVILKSFETGEECDGGEYDKTAEAERKKAQKKFAGRKVFADYQCPNLNAVSYDFDGKFKDDKLVVGDFIAVYAGTTKAEAEKFLQTVKKDYPEATLKQMKATYERIVQ